MWYLATIPMVLFLALLIYQFISERRVNLAVEVVDKDNSEQSDIETPKVFEKKTELRSERKETKRFQEEVKKVSESLNALNAVYEMELKEVNSDTKALDKFYSKLSEALDDMIEAGEKTTAFQHELNKLTGHITDLNKVYDSLSSGSRTKKSK